MTKLMSDTDVNAGLEQDIGQDLRPQKLSHVVAGRLRDQIASGKLKPGTMLQPENKLLEIFNVSRPTLREALRILEAESLISIGRGMRSGATILAPTIQKAAQYANFLLVSEGVTMRELHEARTFLEPAIIGSLKGELLEDACQALRECVDELKKSLAEENYVEVIAGTNRFHERLAYASGNKTIILLIGMLQVISDDVYTSILSSSSAGSSESLQTNMSKTVKGYDALCSLLEKGKTEEAASFWKRYMDRGLDFLDKTKLGNRKLVQNSASYFGV